MSFWSRVGKAWRELKNNAVDIYGQLAAFIDVYGSRASKSGKTVNINTALSVVTAFACWRVIGEGIGQSPCDLFRDREGGKGKDIAKDHALYRILTFAPNELQTPFEFWETLVFHCGFTGNFLAFKSIVRGEIDELIPLEPGTWTVKQNSDLSLTYKVRAADGTEREVPPELLWHVRGPSWCSYAGLDMLKVAREALGLTIAIEEDQAKLYANGLRVSGVYSVDGTLNEKQHDDLRKFIKAYQAEPGGPLILDRAAKYQKDIMSGVDAQTLESRKHQVEEICRWARVMPIMVGHAGNTSPTFASAEQFFIAHVTHTLLPWCRRIETSINKNLIGLDDFLAGVKAKFNLSSLMRGTFADRQDSFAKMLGLGGSPAWAEVNEIRDLDDMNPVDWGNGKPEPTTRVTLQAEPGTKPPNPVPPSNP